MVLNSLQQLLIRSRLPPENVRNALERLQHLQLAIGIKRDKPTRYQATDPINTWSALLLDDSWRDATKAVAAIGANSVGTNTRRKLLTKIGGCEGLSRRS